MNNGSPPQRRKLHRIKTAELLDRLSKDERAKPELRAEAKRVARMLRKIDALEKAKTATEP